MGIGIILIEISLLASLITRLTMGINSVGLFAYGLNLLTAFTPPRPLYYFSYAIVATAR